MSFGDDLGRAASALRDFTDAIEAAEAAVSAGGAGAGAGGAGGPAGRDSSLLSVGKGIAVAAATAKLLDPVAQSFAVGGGGAAIGTASSIAQSIVGNTPIFGPMTGFTEANFVNKGLRDRIESTFGDAAEAGADPDMLKAAQDAFGEVHRARLERRYRFNATLDGQMDEGNTNQLRRSVGGALGMEWLGSDKARQFAVGESPADLLKRSAQALEEMVRQQTGFGK